MSSQDSICAQNSSDFKIDSIAMAEADKAYFFADKTVAFVNMRDDKLRWIKNVVDFFSFYGLYDCRYEWHFHHWNLQLYLTVRRVCSRLQ